MRCQKVRSCLSAFCNGELTGRRFSTVSDHLAICSGCRAEEQNYRSLLKVGQAVNSYRVSDGFNNRLLDRIAHERFAETRSKAYFPKPAPSIIIRRVIPIALTVILVVAVVITNYAPDSNSLPGSLAIGNVQSDDAYRTAQPIDNPNLTGTLRKGWTLDEQLARSDRISRILQKPTFDIPFDNYYRGNAYNVSTSSSRPVPYVDGYYRIQPVITVFGTTASNANKEAEVTY